MIDDVGPDHAMAAPDDVGAAEAAEADAAIEAAAEALPGPAAPAASADGGPTSADYSIAFSPRNVAVGLAIVAGLVAIAARRRRRRPTTRQGG